MGRKIIGSKRVTVSPEELLLGKIDPEKISCMSAFGAFAVAKLQAGCRQKTIVSYREHIAEFAKWCDSQSLAISDLTRSHVERWEGILRLERKNKDTSVQTKIKSIRTFLYWCMDEERGWLKPFSITLPRADMTLKEPYTKEELTALLAPPANEDLSEWRNWAAVGFISRTGVRLSSAVNLKWTDIDFEKHICLLRHTKTNEQYFVPIPSAAPTDLLTWKAISPATAEGYVFFSTYTEKKLSPNALTQAIRQYNLSRGVSKTSVHLLRHTFATLYLQKGGRAEKLQKILGHKTADMTQRYVHFVTDDLVEDIDDFTF